MIMGDCELCGKCEAEYRATVEGARLDVCFYCSKHGENVEKIRVESNKKPQSVNVTRSRTRAITELQLVDDYADRIQEALRKFNIGCDVIAEKMNEKESYIHRIMMGKTRPTEKVAKKIEKELNIKLYEETTLGGNAYVSTNKKKELTLGDLIEIKRK